jgi:hypothetical protein
MVLQERGADHRLLWSAGLRSSRLQTSYEPTDSSFNGRRHPVIRTCRQASSDGFADIVQSLSLRPPLGDAADNRRALGHEHAGFIGLKGHE